MSVVQRLVDMVSTNPFGATSSTPPKQSVICKTAVVSCSGWFLSRGYIYTTSPPFEGFRASRSYKLSSHTYSGAHQSAQQNIKKISKSIRA